MDLRPPFTLSTHCMWYYNPGHIQRDCFLVWPNVIRAIARQLSCLDPKNAWTTKK